MSSSPRGHGMNLTATAMLPFDDAGQARRALRCRLQEIVEKRKIPDVLLRGAKMQVAGPTVVTDAAGNRWYEWVATLTIPRTVEDDRPSGNRLVDDLRHRPTVDELGILRRRAG